MFHRPYFSQEFQKISTLPDEFSWKLDIWVWNPALNMKASNNRKNFKEVFQYYFDTVLNPIICFKHRFLSSIKIITRFSNVQIEYSHYCQNIVFELLSNKWDLKYNAFFFEYPVEAIRIALSKFSSPKWLHKRKNKIILSQDDFLNHF